MVTYGVLPTDTVDNSPRGPGGGSRPFVIVPGGVSPRRTGLTSRGSVVESAWHGAGEVLRLRPAAPERQVPKPQGTLRSSRALQHRLVNPAAIAGVRGR